MYFWTIFYWDLRPLWSISFIESIRYIPKPRALYDGLTIQMFLTPSVAYCENVFLSILWYLQILYTRYIEGGSHEARGYFFEPSGLII